MANIRIPKGWEIQSSLATPETIHANRRQILRGMGFLGLGALLGKPVLAGCMQQDQEQEPPPFEKRAPEGVFPAKRNEKFELDRKITPEGIAGRYNNFYEFTTDKARVWKLAQNFETRPWEVKVSGLVHKPQTFDIDDLLKKMPQEERLYRFRCVEAWAMAVPWTGFSLKALLDRVEPKSQAKYVKLTTFLRPEQAPGQKAQPWYDWPYVEGLRMDEAMNELTLLATGIYGHELPPQHGAPIRLITPWKYGFKSAKSIVSIELVEERPKTFWNESQPKEYGFFANVTPGHPHPRWSQMTERLISTGERVDTKPFNGYGEYVAKLYEGMDKSVWGF
ncbi:MAG: protein-methionine-sulfoxide reductase catalytic subunit MsrP [Planctomycetota bacterium]